MTDAHPDSTVTTESVTDRSFKKQVIERYLSDRRMDDIVMSVLLDITRMEPVYDNSTKLRAYLDHDTPEEQFTEILSTLDTLGNISFYLESGVSMDLCLHFLITPIEQKYHNQPAILAHFIGETVLLVHYVYKYTRNKPSEEDTKVEPKKLEDEHPVVTELNMLIPQLHNYLVHLPAVEIKSLYQNPTKINEDPVLRDMLSDIERTLQVVADQSRIPITEDTAHIMALDIAEQAIKKVYLDKKIK